MPVPPHYLLDLPTELLEHILVFLARHTTSARSIQACRQTCHALNATIAQSKLVLYLERLALLGLYDPPLLIAGAASASASASSASLALPDRAAALRSWEESWNSLAGGGGGDRDHDGGSGDSELFWQKCKPDLRISYPPKPSSSWPYSPRVRYILANILEPDPPLKYQLAVDDTEGQHQGDGVGPGLVPGQQQYGYLDEEDRFSFGPWFIAATRDGLNVRASYSYLDLHGCLGDVGRGGGRGGGGDGDDVGAEYDRVFWTVVKIPLWNVVAFVLSTELDLTVVISCVFFFIHTVISRRVSRLSKTKQNKNLFVFAAPGNSIPKIEDEYQEEEGGERRKKTKTHLVLRPLRFRDGTPHPCAKVPAMRLCVEGATVFHWTQAQVLGDYLLLWIGPGQVDYSLNKLYLVGWKTGSITLVSFFPLIHFVLQYR